jgi:glycosyltransferase involved in cell wall biosynthesis
MGAGAPVTAFDVVFNREVAGSAGVYFADPAGVARACLDAESDPVATAARGFAGQADVAQRYRWDDVADRYEDLAEDLFSRRRDR